MAYYKSATLADITGKVPITVQGQSYLVDRIIDLYQKPISIFTIEDCRILISQNICLETTIPLAIERLQENVIAAGDYYEGDLLQSVMGSDDCYWTAHFDDWTTVLNLYESNMHLFENDNLYKRLRLRYAEFCKLNKR